jgi:hypothetical protein
MQQSTPKDTPLYWPTAPTIAQHQSALIDTLVYAQNTLAALCVVNLPDEDVRALNLAIANIYDAGGALKRILDAVFCCRTKSDQWHVSSIAKCNFNILINLKTCCLMSMNYLAKCVITVDCLYRVQHRNT